MKGSCEPPSFATSTVKRPNKYAERIKDITVDSESDFKAAAIEAPTLNARHKTDLS